jgi:hypothetical protein
MNVTRLFVAAAGLSLVFSGAVFAAGQQQGAGNAFEKGQSSASSPSAHPKEGQVRSTDPSAPADRDAHLGPHDEGQSGKSGKMSQSKSSMGESSQRMGSDQSSGQGSRSKGQDPLEQQQTGPGSGKSSGVGAGQ